MYIVNKISDVFTATLQAAENASEQTRLRASVSGTTLPSTQTTLELYDTTHAVSKVNCMDTVHYRN